MPSRFSSSCSSFKPSPLKIGNVVIDPPLVLAPMAGVTDGAYRRIMARHGAGMVATEMVSVQGLVRDQPATWALCAQDPEVAVPTSVQIFGGDPLVMAEAARRLEDRGVRLMDINAGCPVKKVVKQGAGAVLLETPGELCRIVESVKKAVSVPVTVKVRLGWDNGSIHVVETARLLESAGMDALTIHARTAVQFYGGHADWTWIRRVKEAVGVPVIGNGDVTTPLAADEMLRQTGCDAVMIGRATQGNPWLMSVIAARWGRLSPGDVPWTWQSYRETVLDHVREFSALKPKAVGHICKLFLWYSKHCPGSAALRTRLARSSSVEDLTRVFSDWVEEVDRGGAPFLETKVPEGGLEALEASEVEGPDHDGEMDRCGWL